MEQTLEIEKEKPQTCPECGNTVLRKHGFSYSRQGKAQRWQCKSCWLCFNENRQQVNT